VYHPVTVTAEEFAKFSGRLVTEPLPVTEGIEAVVMEALAITVAMLLFFCCHRCG